MVRYHLKELMADKAFKEGRRVTYDDIIEQTGISRATLSKMANIKGYNTTVGVIESLCRYFGCDISDVITLVPDELIHT